MVSRRATVDAARTVGKHDLLNSRSPAIQENPCERPAPTMSSQTDVAAAIVSAGHRLYERRILASYEGNLSARIGSDRVLTTASGVHK